ncbi:S41 family peptidase [Akkermansiaceae bacterium]|nr:S41 family peptidase [Akkermansiaceae bacterium]MDB4537186.1 S41 family peptidase [Akkermansiaceae bacterium]
MRIITLLAATLGLAQAAPQWLRYPAISPNGETIVFTHGADLYTVPSSGGEARALTQHIAHDFQPVWSPDGKSIAFASNRHGNYDVFFISAKGGKATRLTFHSQNDIPTAFTPDGKHVIFESTRIDSPESLDIPNRRVGETYLAPVAGGRITRLLAIPSENVNFSPSGKQFLYHDRKGYEDPWRKHHTSSVTRDVWLYDLESKAHRKITDFPGEDRNPVWTNNQHFLYLSEQSGCFNIWQRSIKKNAKPKQLTTFDKHPVRFLSRSKNGTIAFGHHGDIYVQEKGSEAPKKIRVSIQADDKVNSEVVKLSNSITEMVVSPKGNEIAFIARGEIFVTSIDHKTTRRITNTPEQERSVSFHPEGRKLVYASERNKSWNLYTTSIEREDEKSFCLSTVLKEETLLASDDETFQPLWSPDGKLIAYIQDRVQLRVYDVEKKASITLHDGSRSYSYSDGDIDYSWSPDSKNLLTMLLQKQRWAENIFMIAADGKSAPFDVSQNGYYDMAPQWAWNGEAAVWISNRHGKKSHASWGSELDIYAGFLTNRAHRLFKLSEAERDEIKDEDWEKEFEKETPLDLEGVEDRMERLSTHSTNMEGAVVAPNGRKVFYMGTEREKYQIWSHDFYKKETKLLTSLGGAGGSGPTDIQISEDGKNLFVLAGGNLQKIGTDDGKSKSLSYDSEITFDNAAERAEMFQHIWRQVREKFHRTDLHGVDWDFYGKEYEQFLPAINNNYDFSEMVSEMLGELDASHTGCFYRPSFKTGDSTASLGIFHDFNHEGPGIRILEVIPRSPLDLLDNEIPDGTIIEKLNGEEIKAGENHLKRLNRIAGERVLLSLFNPADGKRWEEIIRLISGGEESELLYRRWIKKMRKKTEELSGGKLGYVHVRQMDDSGFRDAYASIFGKYTDKDALIVDTRFNGGGWLTEDLTTFLSGQTFLKFFPRGQGNMGGEPLFRWTKPSAVIMGEGNYSDAHLFPYAYKTLKIGKLVGMPVPGTGTAVWWERLHDRSIIFGIPQVSTIGVDGNYLENTQLEPDIKVANNPEDREAGKDRQLESAVKHLLSLPAQKPWPFPKGE